MSTNFFKIAKGVTLTPQSSTPSGPQNGDMYYDSTLNKFRKYENGAWSDLGSGAGGSGVNYIGNPDAETDTSGWATYKDAVQAAPVDGTGGSPTVTFTRTTSSPLRDTGSFLITKDAADRQGEGASYDFTIDAADEAKVLTVTFDHEVASGTYATGDVAVYLYDVTNALVIQPAGYQIQSLVTGLPNKHIATFQTSSNSTSYRLIFHVATASASAYVVKLDNVSVGPQVVQYGAPVTDWQDYTLTIGATTTAPTIGTTAVRSAHWRRVGDSMEIHFQIRQTGAGADGSGTYLYPLPSGYSIDSSKLTFTSGDNKDTGIGTGSLWNASDRGKATVHVYNSTNLYLSAVYDGGEGNHSSTFFGYGNSSQTTTFSAKVPISGWSSTVQMSNDTDTRVVAASYKLTASTANLAFADNVAEIVDYDTKLFDTHNAVTTGVAWKFTAPVPGKYRISAFLIWANSTNMVDASIRLYKNGSFYGMFFEHSGTVAQYLTGSLTLDMNAGDYIQIYGIQDDSTSASRNVYDGANGTAISHVDIERLSGPSAIAASETVAARYTTAAGQSIPTSTTPVVDFGTKTYDTHNSVTTGASWKFTAPISGKYSLKAALKYSNSNYTSTVDFRVLLFKNGSSYSGFSFSGVPTGTFTGPSMIHSDTIQLNAGDFIDVRTNHNEGGSEALLNDATFNYVCIERIGN